MFAHSNACNCRLTSVEHNSFSAVDAHIFAAELVQTILERVDCHCIDDILWHVAQSVVDNNSAREECSFSRRSCTAWLEEFLAVTT